MKIAAASEDGDTISEHFAQAPYYVVVTVQDGKITDREQREKPAHRRLSGEPGQEDVAPEPGTAPAEETPQAQRQGEQAASPQNVSPIDEERHQRMAAAIEDCQLVLAGGMSAAAYQELQQAGIKPIVTDIKSIDEAAQAYIDGKLVDQSQSHGA